MSIIKLFRATSRRDRFIELLRPHVDTLYRMAYRWTQSQSDAEDLVQDILARLANRLDEMEAVDLLRPWLLRILYHRYVDLYRRSRISPLEYEHQSASHGEDDGVVSVVERAVDERDAVLQVEDQQALLRGLEQLDPGQRDVILLHDVEGYTAIEVAEILDINVGTVKSRLHRARTQLKKFLSAGPFSAAHSC